MNPHNFCVFPFSDFLIFRFFYFSDFRSSDDYVLTIWCRCVYTLRAIQWLCPFGEFGDIQDIQTSIGWHSDSRSLTLTQWLSLSMPSDIGFLMNLFQRSIDSLSIWNIGNVINFRFVFRFVFGTFLCHWNLSDFFLRKNVFCFFSVILSDSHFGSERLRVCSSDWTKMRMFVLMISWGDIHCFGALKWSNLSILWYFNFVILWNLWNSECIDFANSLIQ